MFQTSEYNSWYDLPMYMTNNTYPQALGSAVSASSQDLSTRMLFF